MQAITVLLVLAVTLTAAPRAQDDETELLRLVNAERSDHGLDPVVVDPDLLAYARNHTEWMIDNGLTHSSAHGHTGWTWGIWVASESVGRTSAASIDRLHRAFMNSPPHRQVVLDPRWTHVGIGVEVGSGGLLYVTKVFAYAQDG